MQTMSADVANSGDNWSILPKSGITPAEAALLIQLHNPETRDVLRNCRLTADVDRSSAEEKARLLATYPRAKEWIETQLAGLPPRVPETFDDAGLTDQLGLTDAKPMTRGRPRKAPDRSSAHRSETSSTTHRM